MFVTILSRDKKSWVVEAQDGRRFVISGKKDVVIRPQGEDNAFVSARGISFKAAVRLLEEQLSQQPSPA